MRAVRELPTVLDIQQDEMLEPTGGVQESGACVPSATNSEVQAASQPDSNIKGESNLDATSLPTRSPKRKPKAATRVDPKDVSAKENNDNDDKILARRIMKMMRTTEVMERVIPRATMKRMVRSKMSHHLAQRRRN